MATPFDRFASGISASQGTGEEQRMGVMPQRGSDRLQAPAFSS